MTRIAGLLATTAIVFAACSSSGATTAPSAAGGGGSSMDALVAAAKAEGNLTTIALPHSWCNYGDLLAGFTAKYGIAINELNPDGGSKDEITAIEANKDNKGPAAPDVVDVGLAFGPQGKDAGTSRPTRSRPGIRSRRPPRTPTASGTATTTASCPSRSTTLS